MITIRAEKEEDYTVIHEINILAFGRENEARLVKKIRERADFITELSLVAIKKGEGVGPYIRNSKTRVLALNLCGRGWNAAEIKGIELSL